MKSQQFKTSFILLCSFTAILSLNGCNAARRMSEIGREPQMSNINNPTKVKGYRPVDLPMPSETLTEYSPNSLWKAGSRAFFKDQRASRVGDILTVNINFKNEASLNNMTDKNRESKERSTLGKLFGADKLINSLTGSGDDVTNFGTPESKYKGDGKIKRDEEIKDLNIAALITQILPNGNFVISAKQQVRVNYEMRDVFLTGIVRPEDIDKTNKIGIEKIAEARVSYGGKGEISDIQQPRYGQQLYDIFFPY
jgi:flagellar L-ring protein precursor FlgH